MAFGIGINDEPVSAGSLRGEQTKIACDCWFTSTGRTIPHTIKYQDKEGLIRTINDINVIHYENKNYSGVPSVEYNCIIRQGILEAEVRLVFFTEEKRWVMFV